MATPESMAIRCDAALETIEQQLGLEAGAIPRLHRDREMLRAIQLEQIAAALQEQTMKAQDHGDANRRAKR